MSKVADAYDALLNRLIAVYPTHLRMPNPYKVEENSEQILRKSYGLGFGSGVNTNRMVSCQLTWSRNYPVVLTRVVRANEFNATAKASVEKELFEDQYLLIKDIESLPTLGVTNVIAKSSFIGDGGLEYIFGEKDNYLKLVSTVNLEIWEDLLI